MFLAFFAAAAFLSTCRGAPPVRPLIADDRDRLIALMGGIDAHLLEVQRGAGDPIEADYVKSHLAGMRENFAKACELELRYDGFRARARHAIGTIRRVEEAGWTAETREGHYAALKSLCAGCHDDFGPPLSVEVKKPSSWDSCGRCHERVYQEWDETLHSGAWLDPVYRGAAGDPPKMECRGCHSMEPILEREIATDVSYRPVYRPYNHREGVNCTACHGLSDGSVAASRDLPGAPCRPRRDARLLSPEFCGACHNPTHAAYDEWRRSSSGKSCTECHARTEGKFTHRMFGVRDPEFVKQGLAWTCEVKEGELRLALTNRSGHKLPAEVPSRNLRVTLAIDDREETLFFRRPNKQIVGEKDNRLLPDETRVITRRVAGAGRVKVSIRYQQSPFAPPRAWIDLGTWERKF